MTRRTDRRADRDLTQALADNERLTTNLADALKRLDGVKSQLVFHKDELSRAQADRAEETMRADAAERRLEPLQEALVREREHTAGSCLHAAELRELKYTLTALEWRVHSLQEANRGHEALGWQPGAQPVSTALANPWRLH